MDGLRFAVGTLSVFPVRVSRVDREVAGRAMTLAPAVGLALGVVAGLPLLLPGPGLLAAALSLGLLALLTRGLHLDGLADLADGLGSGKPGPQALDIMKKSDIGPFGVMTLVFTLLVQAAALAGLHADRAWAVAVLVTACVSGRLALTWACRAGVPAARPTGLGVMVAGTVRPAARWAATAATLTLATAAGAALTPAALTPAAPTPAALTPAALTSAAPTSAALTPAALTPVAPAWLVLPLAVLAGLGAALALLWHARRRLGGVTGDVLGALTETATTAALVTCALLT
ncbi:adenosylcobinamide-GDP ribazoletransferase [Nonomuraea typhae]|uniref:adenosylcobinamide-GDP ribazoletransferase n=1 Tax=Nonomuraea typhae TaxID=2603600 RepID=UPI0012F817B9|nr:adenosylcobinamide-GDP ribazoletransferase [Nonomuraea typhae]